MALKAAVNVKGREEVSRKTCASINGASNPEKVRAWTERQENRCLHTGKRLTLGASISEVRVTTMNDRQVTRNSGTSASYRNNLREEQLSAGRDGTFPATSDCRRPRNVWGLQVGGCRQTQQTETTGAPRSLCGRQLCGTLL